MVIWLTELCLLSLLFTSRSLYIIANVILAVKFWCSESDPALNISLQKPMLYQPTNKYVLLAAKKLSINKINKCYLHFQSKDLFNDFVVNILFFLQLSHSIFNALMIMMMYHQLLFISKPGVSSNYLHTTKEWKCRDFAFFQSLSPFYANRAKANLT